MNKYTLIAVVGKTDPMRSDHDGPILHIVRQYDPERVVLILTKEIGESEAKYQYNEKAIHLLSPECRVESIMTGIKNPHSFDEFGMTFLHLCNEEKEKYPDNIILLDITSGTPQMETGLCMIALSDEKRFIPVQVATPMNKSNESECFNPDKDSVEEWYRKNKDNEKDAVNRCMEPKLLIFKRPLIQHQIISLIKSYDYSAACKLYSDNKALFSKEVGYLLEHAKYRLNLQSKEAEEAAKKLGKTDVLYSVKNKEQKALVEFYNSMRIKQKRGELNDFALRIEVFTEYLAIYLLSKFGIELEDITDMMKRKNTKQYSFNCNKCEKIMPGIKKYLDKLYGGDYQWGKPVNAKTFVQMCSFKTEEKEYKKYSQCTGELNKWIQIVAEVRNPAAHTMIAITEDLIKNAYGNKSSEALCLQMRNVMFVVFDKKVSSTVFDIYEDINKMICVELER